MLALFVYKKFVDKCVSIVGTQKEHIFVRCSELKSNNKFPFKESKRKTIKNNLFKGVTSYDRYIYRKKRVKRLDSSK